MASETFAVIADTQETMKIERLWGRESNPNERRNLIKNLAFEKPQFIAFLGDFVAKGSSAKNWEYFDEVTQPISHIPIFPALGNHDYYGNNTQALNFIYQKFSFLKESHWYVKKWNSLALIFLDSNISPLGDLKWKAQENWLKNLVNDLEKDQSVQGIFFFAHHPPFTNSKITGDGKHIQKSILPIMLQSKKTIAYISGHAHGYEHFFENKIHFVVSGGGGGPRVEYLTGKHARHIDLYQAPAKRPFNYLLLSIEEEGIKVLVKGLEKHKTQVNTIDEYIMSWR